MKLKLIESCIAAEDQPYLHELRFLYEDMYILGKDRFEEIAKLEEYFTNTYGSNIVEMIHRADEISNMLNNGKVN